MNRIEIKARIDVSDEGMIEGLAWPFGTPDLVGDVIEKGAFAAPAKLPMLFAHDQAQAVGVWDSISETDEGIRVKGRLLVHDVSRAREVRALVREGAVNGLSLGFITKKAVARKGGGRTITALDLAEVSIVAVPCHPGAHIQTIKEKPMSALKKATRKPVRKELEADPAEIEEVVEEIIEESALEDRVSALETDVATIKDDVAAIKGSGEEVEKGIKRLEQKLGRPGIVRVAQKPEEVEKKAFTAYLRNGESAVEAKTLRRGSDPKGGYLAPPEFVKEMLRELVEYSPIREIARVGNTGSGSVIIPGRVGRTNAKWKGELETQEESTLDFREVEIPIHEINTFVDVSNQLLEDAEIDVEAEIRTAFAEDLSEKEGRSFLFGSGVKQPEGIMTRDDIKGIVNGHATNLSADALVSLLYSLPAVYRNDGSWLMNGTTLGVARKLKDGQGNYLWQPSFQAGQPETILGRPVVEAVDMPDVAANAFPIAYGDFHEAYRIYDRVDVDVLVNPYTRATEGVTRFHMRKRLGAGVVQPKALRKLKMAAA